MTMKVGRFSEREIDSLKQVFAQQLFTVAAILATTQYKLFDFDEAVSDALDLYDSVIEGIEEEGEDE